MGKTWFIYQKEWTRPWNKKSRKEKKKFKNRKLYKKRNLEPKGTKTKNIKKEIWKKKTKNPKTIFKLRAYTSYSDMHRIGAIWGEIFLFFFERESVLDFETHTNCIQTIGTNNDKDIAINYIKTREHSKVRGLEQRH